MRRCILFLLLLPACYALVNSTANATDSATNLSQHIDLDLDGYASPVDCNDSDALVHPNATELCNRRDDDCDSLIDEGFDADNDSYHAIGCIGYTLLDCDDSRAQVHPGVNETAFNSLDDDCNASTPDAPSFGLLVPSSLYLGEPGSFTLLAPPKTTVFVTISTPSSSDNTLSVYTGHFPVVQPFPYLRKAGDYTVDAVFDYYGHLNVTSSTFVVRTTLSASITGPQTLQQGEQTTFTAIGSGGLGTLAYSWSFGDGTTAQGQSVTHVYAAQGSYQQSLTVTDAEGNARAVTRTCIVPSRHSLTVTVTSGGSVIKNAKVTLRSLSLYTDSKGVVLFTDIPAGTHRLTAERAGYYDYDEDFTIDANRSVTANLEVVDDTPPSIELLSPADGAKLSEPLLRFRARESDSCVLYLSTDGSWWSREALFERLNGVVEREHVLSNYSSGSYWWKVRCEDLAANAVYSSTRSFIVSVKDPDPQPTDQPANIPDEQLDTNVELYSQINDLIAGLDSLSPDERQAAQMLGLEEQLLEAKRVIQNSQRDLFNLRYRQDNTSERELLRHKLEQAIADAQAQIVTSLEVRGKTSFVKYLTEEEVAEALRLADIDLDAASIHRFQKGITISATVMAVSLEYGSRQEMVTLVEKQLSIAAANQTARILEVIPPSLAIAPSLLVLPSTAKLRNSTVIEFPVQQLISYRISGELDPALIEKVITLALPAEVSNDVLTGAAVSELVYVDYRLGVGIMIALLAAMIVTYAFGKLGMPFASPREWLRCRQALAKVRNALGEGNREEAAKRYAELSALYKSLSPATRRRTHQPMLDAYHSIAMHEFRAAVKSLNSQDAMAHERIRVLYSALPPRHKRQAYAHYQKAVGGDHA